MFVANMECAATSQSIIHFHTERDYAERSTLCPDLTITRTRSSVATCSGDVLVNGVRLKHVTFDVAGVEAACALQTSELLNERPCDVCVPES
jgi:hypothetical protein